MRHRLSLFLLTFFLVCMIPRVSVSQSDKPPVTEDTKEEVSTFLRSYFDHLSDRSIPMMKGYWDETSASFKGFFETTEKTLAEMEAIELVRFQVLRFRQLEETVQVEVLVEFTAINSKTKSPARVFDTDNRFLTFNRKNSEWKIVNETSLESHVADLLSETPERSNRVAILTEYDGLVPIAITRALVIKGQRTLFQLGGAFESVTMFERALETAEHFGDRSHFGAILPNLGQAYGRTGEYDKSIKYFERSADLFRERNELLMESRVWTSLALTYGHLGDFRKAIELTHRSLTYAEKIGDKREMINPLINLASAYAVIGEFHTAIELQSRTLDLLKEIAETDDAVLKSPQMAAILGNIGKIYADLGINHKAIEFYMAKTNLNEAAGRRDPANLYNIADVYLADGELEKAEKFYNEAFELFALNKHKQGLQGTLNALGDLYLAKGDLNKSLEYKVRALEESIELGQLNRIDKSRLDVANAYLRLGGNEAAVELVSEIAERKPETGSESLYREANYLIGKILISQGELENAKAYLDRAISTAENLRSNSHLNVKPYHELIGLQLKQGKMSAAFETAQSTKARTLLDLFYRGRHESSKALSAEEALEEKRLRSEIASLGARVSSEAARKPAIPGRVEELEGELVRKRLALDSFQNLLYVRHPELKVHRGDLDPVTVADAVGLLRDHRSAIADFVVGEDFSFVFFITQDKSGEPRIRSKALPIKKSDLEKQVNAFSLKVARGDLDIRRSAGELYDLLLRDVEADLAGKTNLIIVPDGPLWNLPFQVLIDRNGKSLLENTAISYAPSLTALREMSKKSVKQIRKGDTELIAFGNPIVGKETKERVHKVYMDEKLEPIPEAERLVNELRKMYGPSRSKVFTGADAREAIAKSEAPKYRIVQFATHGILNNISPMYSYLVLAKDENDPNEDGLLEAWELKDLDLNADIVILSACETARGKIANGEGIIGMTWASFIAGAPTTVASQWKVESSSTTELMLEFHRQLRTGKVSKAEALRRASLKVMKMPKYRHPSYWAGFILVGDGS